MKFCIPGKGDITLTQAHFKAAGGQGSVYVEGGTAYKIYADPKHMISLAKLHELSAITQANIIRPLEAVFDQNNNAVGYTMRHVENAYALCQLFPKAFRQRTKLTPDVALSLVSKLQAGVRHIHSKGILLVDLNEMNFLVAGDFGELYFIDVDSYQTRSFPATALMESVRDRHAKQFDERSDWFSFAVVSFQMFVGLHPYKGTYPKLPAMDARMRANISVLHAGVAVPAACLPLHVIPPIWLDWYKAMLEEGKRLPPPEVMQATITTASLQTKSQAGSEQFDLAQLYEFDSEVRWHFHSVTITQHSVYAAGKRLTALPSHAVQIAITPRQQHIIAAWLDGSAVRFRNLTTGADLPAEIRAEQLMTSAGRIYLKAGTSLLEVVFSELTNRLLIHTKAVGNVLPQATQLFAGVAIQNLLGAYYASFVPASGICYQARLKELDGYQIIEAKAERNILIVMAAKNGTFDKFIYRFAPEFDAYDVRVRSDVTLTDINFTVLDTGVCLHLNDRDELELLLSGKGAAGLKIITDTAISNDDKLFHDGTQALIARDHKLYRITMKQS